MMFTLENSEKECADMSQEHEQRLTEHCERIATLDAQQCSTDVVGNGQTNVNDILAVLDRFDSGDPQV